MDLRFEICNLRLAEKPARVCRDRAPAEPVAFAPAPQMRAFAPQSQIANRKSQISFRPGFSFTEILFAVMILGIGFIMIAAMFPVAIKQTQATGEETVAAAIAKSGADYLGRNAYDFSKLSQPPYTAFNYNTMPVIVAPAPASTPPVAPAAVVVASGSLWTSAVGNMILPSDHRYGWVPFYRREPNSNFAQIIVIGTQIRNRPAYDQNDFLQFGSPPGNANLQGKPVMVALTDGSIATPPVPDTITFTPMRGAPPAPAAANSPDYTGFVAEGCYVVIANDPGVIVSNPGNNPPPVLRTANGYTYRVGLPRPDISPTTWELMPGNDMKGASYKPILPANQGNILAYVVGRGYADPGANPPDTSPTGPAMDIAVYTTFVRVNTAQ
ncbi:MAG: hypothetical protein JWN51_3133 [Phycisphaerales bacterium]|nr:hypothetical protein [Phycisphaerales bacterium]